MSDAEIAARIQAEAKMQEAAQQAGLPITGFPPLETSPVDMAHFILKDTEVADLVKKDQYLKCLQADISHILSLTIITRGEAERLKNSMEIRFHRLKGTLPKEARTNEEYLKIDSIKDWAISRISCAIDGKLVRLILTSRREVAFTSEPEKKKKHWGLL